MYVRITSRKVHDKNGDRIPVGKILNLGQTVEEVPGYLVNMCEPCDKQGRPLVVVAETEDDETEGDGEKKSD